MNTKVLFRLLYLTCSEIPNYSPLFPSYEIFKFLPSEVQVCLFSATLPNEILELTQKFMRNPVRILVKKDELTLEGKRNFGFCVGKDELVLKSIGNLSLF